MNKKLIILLVSILIIVISSTAYASVNGFFEGFPIVNVKVDGNEVKGDVPAIRFGGRTMVPVRFVSQALGTNVDWDETTETVLITSQKHKNNLKLYNSITRQYHILDSYSQKLLEFDYNVYISYEGVARQYPDAQMQVQADNVVLKRLEAEYDNNKISTTSIIDSAKSQGLDTSDMDTILQKHRYALDYFKTIITLLENYKPGKSDNEIFKNRIDVYNPIYDSTDMCQVGYTKYYDMTQK